MRILVLGGTAWVGREVAELAVAAGHDVVCVARGSGTPAADARLVTADRDTDDALAAVAGEHWDAVVDVARQPGHVRRSTRDLAGSADHYVFVSSISVYADSATPGQDESAALLEPLVGDVMETMETYGAAKVACEQAVTTAFGERCTLVRAGLLGGPGDHTDRTTYFPWRFAEPATPDGSVLVPDVPEMLTAVLDARDLAAWVLRCATDRIGGVFNAAGPPTTLADHLEAARSVAGHTATVAWADPQWLVAQGVGPWMGARSLPLWLPVEDRGMTSGRADAAYAAGLAPRPLEQTLADALAWRRADPDRPLASGLTPADERDLLALRA